MRRVRLIPTLLLDGSGIYKTRRFADAQYLGDPLNIVKLFNDKEVDELVLLDFRASREARPPDLGFLEQIAGESFVPLAYGGGVRTVDEMAAIYRCGYEKIVLGTGAFEVPELVTSAAQRFGSQSVVVSVDVRKPFLRHPSVHVRSGTRNTGVAPSDYAHRMEDAGAGELLLHSVDREGTYSGYDLDLVRAVTTAVSIPVVACGGARDVEDCLQVISYAGASAAAAGSLFVYQGEKRGILINYPSQKELVERVYSRL